MRVLICATLLTAFSVNAHEFWLEPTDYTVSENQLLLAEVRSGESFTGDAFPFMPERIVRAELIDDGNRETIKGQAGAMPAIQHNVDTPGIRVLSYQSTAATHVHETFSGFRNFLEEDGLQWVETAHKARDLPDSGFSENFTRYAKSIVSVGGVSGYDQPVGQPYEMVVLSRLYHHEDNHDFTLQLLAFGQPVSDTQVTVFRKNAQTKPELGPLKLMTDQSGKVSVPRGEGGEYLVSAVVMEQGESVPWHSHWASVTFYADMHQSQSLQ